MLTHYRYFVAIVEHGGLTAAANALSVSQPALTRSLQKLEFQLDTKLLDRQSGPLTLTAAGHLLLSRARGLLAEQRSLRADLTALTSNESSVVHVNGSPMTAVDLLPRILIRMAAEYPQYRVSVRGDNGANYAWKIEALLSGELDVALTIHDHSVKNDNLIQSLLFEPELRIVVRRDHPAALLARVTLADLLQNRWIMPPADSSPRAVIENEFALHRLIPPRDSIEISDWRIALDLVHQTNFVTAIPFHAACFNDQFERFHILPITFSVRPLGVSAVVRSLSMKREPTRAFVEMAHKVVAETHTVKRSAAGRAQMTSRSRSPAISRAVRPKSRA